MQSSRVICIAATAAALIGGAIADDSADAAAAKASARSAFAAHPTGGDGTIFFQNFDGDVSYHLSEFAEYQGQDVQARTIEGSAFENDKALVLEADAHRYGVTMDVEEQGGESGDFVIQYEVRLSKGLECGGAYLKLLNRAELPEDGNLTPDSPYVIMFGPDKCGDNNKVHFILRHQNPKSNEWEEKHFAPNTPLTIQNDQFTHLYTLVVRADNTFSIKVDNVVAQEGNLLESMKPAINPPAEIDDPDDTKPADWVDDPKIADPEASKPEDWDEDAPKTILDEAAEMPEGWLEDQTYLIPDPDSVKPEEWDDEDDGEWEAPTVQNSACASAPGCETWVRPTIANPAYKGKWSAPLIDNPAYISEWAPQRIENPHFFVDAAPAEGLAEKVGALAVEVWIHKNGGVTFDNILLSNSEEAASDLATKTFKIKADLERSNSDDLQRKRRHEANLKILEEGGALAVVKYYFYEALDFARAWPIATAAGVLGVVALLIYTCCVTCCKMDDDFPAEDEDDEEDDEDGDAPAPAATATPAAAPTVAQATSEGEREGDDVEEEDDSEDEAPVLTAKSDKAKKDE